MDIRKSELFENTFLLDEQSDIKENNIREKLPEILEILLIDRTTKKKIIWGNDNYIKLGIKDYSAKSAIKTKLITGKMGDLIMPRALKSGNLKHNRTKSKAEVFTPTWIIKKQNDKIESLYIDDNIDDYINRTWLEVTCGEAPYMATRYDMESGDLILLKDRCGFIDRKFKRINHEIESKEKWFEYAQKIYKSSYGFEWNGDSLLLARENLLYTFRDYYLKKWNCEPSKDEYKIIAIIISFNIFQMDGVKYIIPLSQKKSDNPVQLSFFDEMEEVQKNKYDNGTKVKIMNWELNRMEYFDKEIKYD